MNLLERFLTGRGDYYLCIFRIGRIRRVAARADTVSPRSPKRIGRSFADFIDLKHRFRHWAKGFLWRDNNMQPTIVKKRLLAGAISAPLAMAVLTLVLLWHLRTERVYTNGLEHSDQVLNEAYIAKGEIVETQAAFEHILASADAAYFVNIHDAMGKVQASLRRLLASTADNPFQKDRVVDISNREARWSTEIQHGLDSLNNSFDSARSAAILKQVNPYTQAVLESFDDLSSVEGELRNFRLKRRNAQERVVLWLVPISAAGVALVLIFISWRDIAVVVRDYL